MRQGKTVVSNNSSSGGYLSPAPQAPYPGNLTFLQFMNTVFVGLSGLQGSLVRPAWQKNPPGQPSGDTDWMAFAVQQIQADANSWVGQDSSHNNLTQRHEELEILCSFYGPNSEQLGSQVRDGFYIQQNLEALKSALMGLKEASLLRHVPELVNEVWISKWIMTVTLRREIIRVYPILNFVSASGSLKAEVSGAVQTFNISVSGG